MSVAVLLSNWKVWTSFRKMKSGTNSSTKWFSVNLFFFKFSTFHVREVIEVVDEGDNKDFLDWVFIASTEVVDLSDSWSLKIVLIEGTNFASYTIKICLEVLEI